MRSPRTRPMRRCPRSSRRPTASHVPHRWSESTGWRGNFGDTPRSSRSIRTTGSSASTSAASLVGSSSAASDKQQAVDTPLAEHRDVLGFHRGIAVGVGQEHRVAGFAQRGLGAERDLRKRRIRDFADDEANRQRDAPPHALREHVEAVARLLDRCRHAHPHRRTHVGWPDSTPATPTTRRRRRLPRPA